MDIELKYLLEIPDLNKLEIPIAPKQIEKTHVYALKKGQVVKHSILTKDYIYDLLKKQIKRISIVPNQEQFSILIKYLRSKYPKEFKKPTHIYTLHELETRIALYEKMNEMSDKKRHIILLQDISSTDDLNTDKRETIIQYNTELYSKHIEKMKKHHFSSVKYQCLETENGILIITISKDQQDTLNTIMAATDLVARLEKYFILDLAYEIKEAIDKFKVNQPHLVVFGNYKCKDKNGNDVINRKARYTYLELRNYDIFLKSLFIDQINLHENRDKLANDIMIAYKQPYVLKDVDSKRPLSVRDKKKYLDLLDRLNRNFSREEYLKLSIQIKTLNHVYQVSYLQNQLTNIYKLHSVPYTER